MQNSAQLQTQEIRKPRLTIFYQFNPWHSTIGGIQTIVVNFIKYAPEEFEVRLVGTGSDSTQSAAKWQDAELAGREIKFMPLFSLQNDNVRSRIPTTLKYTAALLGRSLSSDFMHFHRIEPTLAALPWKGHKTLFVHNDIQKQMQAQNSNANAILWRRFPKAYFLMERSLIQQFDQILSCNSESIKLYQERYPNISDRISYIRNTVDNDVFYALPLEKRQQKRRAIARKLSLSEDTKFILFAGRLHPQKNPILLVRAIQALSNPNIHLLIAGDGEMADAVQSEIYQLGLSDNISMLGSVPRSELAELHQAASVFVLTSAYEGLPLVALEALACGTPVVTTRCGDTPKLLTANTGVVCPEQTPNAVADALRQVLLHLNNYPSEACVQVAQPYGARSVIQGAYSDMFQCWKQQIYASAIS